MTAHGMIGVARSTRTVHRRGTRGSGRIKATQIDETRTIDEPRTEFVKAAKRTARTTVDHCTIIAIASKAVLATIEINRVHVLGGHKTFLRPLYDRCNTCSLWMMSRQM